MIILIKTTLFLQRGTDAYKNRIYTIPDEINSSEFYYNIDLLSRKDMTVRQNLSGIGRDGRLI